MSERILYNDRMQPCWVYAPGNLTATSCTATYATGTHIDLKYNWNLGADNGNLVGTVNDINGNRSQSLGYDQVNRITTAGTLSSCSSNCWNLTYGIDQWGNVLSATGTGSASTFSYSVQVSAANQITNSPFTYDADGNLLNDITSEYAWNAESEMKTGGGVNYLYDGQGRRVEKQGSELYWYGPNGEVLNETDTTGSTTDSAFSEYIYFAGDRVARRDYENNVFYYFEDQVHTSRVIAEIPNGGTSSALCYDADFYPYGGEDDFTSTCQQNYKFQGKERDPETGNDYFGARFYSSTFGRFLSPDWSSMPVPVPYADLTNPQSLNLYAIVHDNPTSFADLNGHAQSDDEVKLEEVNEILDFATYTSCGFWCRLGQRFRNLFNGFGFQTDQQVADMILKEASWLRAGGIQTEGMTAKQVNDVYNAIQIALMQGRNSTNVDHMLIIIGMIGSGGTQVTSKTLWQEGDSRIDVENPNPGKRPGQLHYQDSTGKYLYDFETGQFKGLSATQNENLLSNPDVQGAIQQGYKYLGVSPQPNFEE